MIDLTDAQRRVTSKPGAVCRRATAAFFERCGLPSQEKIEQLGPYHRKSWVTVTSTVMKL
jgi:hypothetical protein